MMGGPLQALKAGIFSLYALRLFTYLWNSGQHLPSLFNIDLKYFFRLQATVWVVVSVSLGGGLVSFFSYMPY
jgi:hypothetical protein